MNSSKLGTKVFATVALLIGISVTHNRSFANDGGVTQNPSRGLTPKPLVGNSSRGEELYNASCVVCHGPKAAGDIGPRLAENPILINEAAFVGMVFEGRHIMPPLKDALMEQQIADIRTWLMTLH